MVPNSSGLQAGAWREAAATDDPYAAFQAKVPDFQPFHPVVYAIDTFVPLVNLYQERNRIPQPEGKDGAWPWVRLYLWLHTAMGWAITALFAASVTGLVKKDV